MQTDESRRADGRQVIHRIRGLPMPVTLKRENVEGCMDYVPRDGDVVVTSYPKTGTTWLQYIVLQILSKGEITANFVQMSTSVAPYVEMTGVSAVETMTSPRTYKHHLPYSMVKQNPKAKVLYIHRHPEDTFVSYFHFIKCLPHSRHLEFDRFVEDLISGEVGYGRYFDHVASYLDHEEDDNLLVVSYENLHSNTREEILRIGKFLGEEHHKNLVEDSGLVENILKKTSFASMSESCEMEWKGEKVKVGMFRKGKIGDGRNALTSEQRRCIREAAMKVFPEDTRVFKEWYGK